MSEFDLLFKQHKLRIKAINVRKDSIIKPRHTGFKIVRMFRILRHLYNNNFTLNCKTLCIYTGISKTQLYDYLRHLSNHSLVEEIRDKKEVVILDTNKGHFNNEDYGNKVYFRLTSKGIETYKMLDSCFELLGFSQEINNYKE